MTAFAVLKDAGGGRPCFAPGFADLGKPGRNFARVKKIASHAGGSGKFFS